MDEATFYILENLPRTKEVYDAISKLDDGVLPPLEKAVRDAIPDWFGDGWKVWTGSKLNDDEYDVSVARTDLMFQNDGGEEDAYVWVDFFLWGDDPVWSLFGLPSRDESDYVAASVTLKGLGSLEDYERKLAAIDDLIGQKLTAAGYTRRGGKSEPQYQNRDLIFSTAAVLKALKDGDWEEALLPLKNLWEPVAALDWDRIERTLMKGK